MILDNLKNKLMKSGVKKGDVLVISSDVQRLLLKLIEENRLLKHPSKK